MIPGASYHFLAHCAVLAPSVPSNSPKKQGVLSFCARPVDAPRAPVALHTVDGAGMLVTVLHLAPLEIVAFYSSTPRLVIDLSRARL